MQVGKYNLENEQKANDAVAEVGNKNDAALIAAYDKRGGLIRLDGVPVPLGTFWDFAKKESRKPDAKTLAYLKGAKLGAAKKAKVAKVEKAKEEAKA